MSKLTQEKIDDLIAERFFFHHGTMTVCILQLTNGAQVLGQSNVIDPANWSAEIGKNIAFEDARNKIWELEGYALKTRGE